jgi:hypothetical protein
VAARDHDRSSNLLDAEPQRNASGPRSVAECLVDAAVPKLRVLVYAACVNPQENRHPVTSAARDLGGRDASVEGERHATMAQVIGPRG